MVSVGDSHSLDDVFEQDVGRLDVTMDQTLGMGGGLGFAGEPPAGGGTGGKLRDHSLNGHHAMLLLVERTAPRQISNAGVVPKQANGS
jgi:hypothetical protein